MGSSGKCGGRAELVLRYRDEGLTRAVAAAVSPDNYQVPAGVSVAMGVDNMELKASVECTRVGSLIATLDDLLSCLSAAEKALGIVT